MEAFVRKDSIHIPLYSGAGRTRTPDFWFWRPAFYQLNYCPGERQF
jgi:hypothetical protein